MDEELLRESEGTETADAAEEEALLTDESQEAPAEEPGAGREGALPGAGEPAAERGPDRRREVEDFLTAFPQVEVGAIPRQVWARAAGGLGLTGAYALYENALLRERLAALEQNGANARRSLGSLGSSQGTGGGGSIESYWDEAGQ